MIIIDGYNLLHASGVFGDVRGPLGLEHSRQALLNHLVDLLGPDANQTIVVFDAAEAPEGLPSRYLHESIQVLFARDYPDADSLIEEMVEEISPSGLVVVSSDRRVQAAARRRRAVAVNSEEWLAERRQAMAEGTLSKEIKPTDPGPGDVEAWKRYFGF
jgi:hypothetical protein